jgi:hypothetical protein
MAPPNDKALTNALLKSVRTIYRSDEKDQLSVRFVRTKVEEEFDLEEGFLSEGKWKDKSKGIIKGEVVSFFGVPEGQGL